MGKHRTAAELDFVAGEHRSFEWFWSARDEMPGLDDFETLGTPDQDAVIATFEYWSSVPLGT